MPNPRLRLALERVAQGDWLYFEQFAAEFLAVEFPSLRTTAASSGDGGRDGQLYVPGEDPTVVLQYSVTSDWSGKIRATLKRLGETLPDITTLIYCTNQTIGVLADDLVIELRKDGIALDVRDQSWFVDREVTHPQRETAASELIERFVTPLLVERRIAERVAAPLSSGDARIALLHLSLEGYDQASDKGLTKSCFEALVRSVLHGSSADSVVASDEVFARMRALVPVGDEAQVTALVAGALTRLSTRGGPVKHITRDETYHLSYEEQQRIDGRAVEFLAREEAVDEEIRAAVRRAGGDTSADGVERVKGIRIALDALLLTRGEEFAATVTSGQSRELTGTKVVDAIREHLPTGVEPDLAASIVLDLLEAPGDAIAGHLRMLADGYTLFAFLRQTPDVQKVVLEVFRDGDIWLDTTLILPLIAERLVEDAEERNFTNIISAARDAGLRFFVTDGIVEEVLSHLTRGLQFARTASDIWVGRVPFISAAYASSGRSRGTFVRWLEEFRGDRTPEQDLLGYLTDIHGIESRNLDEAVEAAPLELRAAVQEIWHEAHERRRTGRGAAEISPAIAARLVSHDVENYVGVLQLRGVSAIGPMGYREWWLTLDHIAFGVHNKLREFLPDAPPPSPVLSVDFLVEMLRLGPLRSAIERDVHVSLPVMASIGRFEDMPIELIDLADTVRRQSSGLNERIVSRRVRDALNDARWRIGEQAQGGARAMEERIRERLEEQEPLF